jgi:hypothetical protein
MRHKDGSVRWLLVRGVIGRDAAGAPVRALGTAVDVTDLKLAEHSVRHLTREIINAQENERARIARELHDNVAQDLSSLKIACEAIFGAIPNVSPELVERFAESSRILQGAIISIREMAYALRPSNLDHLGFVRAVERLCRDFEEKTGIRTSFLQTGMDGVSLDADDGRLKIRGWVDDAGLAVEDVLPRLADQGVSFLVYTDISRDGMQTGVNLPAMERLLALTDLPVIAAGGVATLDDVAALYPLHARGLAGVVTGRAIYAGTLDFKAALGWIARQ